MTVIKYAYADGSASYQWVEYTDADYQAAIAAPDTAAWIEANATIVQTVTTPVSFVAVGTSA